MLSAAQRSLNMLHLLHSLLLIVHSQVGTPDLKILCESATPGIMHQQLLLMYGGLQVLTSYLEQAEPDHQYDEATQSAEEQLQAYMHEYTAAQGRDHGQLCRQLFTLQIQPEQVRCFDHL